MSSRASARSIAWTGTCGAPRALDSSRRAAAGIDLAARRSGTAIATTAAGSKEKIMNRGPAGKQSAAAVSMALLASLVLAACGDRQAPAPVVTPAPQTTTPSPPPPASPPPSTSSAPVIAPGTGTDVESKKGSETGMVGGEAGTVPSSGKPGTGTESGGGTGAAQSSDDTTQNKK
jgi:hypothetical protein